MRGLASLGAAALAALLVAHSASAQAPKGPGVWMRKAPMFMSRGEVAAAFLDGKIYVVGGSVAGRSALASNEAYDPATENWLERAPLPRPLSHVGLAAAGGLLYAIGGFSSTTGDHEGAVASLLAYDPRSDSWRERAPMKAPRGSVGVVMLNGKIHAIGGRGLDKQVVATHEIYDPETDRWRLAAPIGRARDHLAAVVAEGRIHVIGGRTVTLFDNTDIHEIYDEAVDRWQPAAPLPTPRSSGAATLLGSMILVAGGECRNNTTYAETEGYDLKSGRWEFLSPLPAGRHAFAAATVGDTAYFAGGSTGCGGTGVTNDLLGFRLPATR
jgi:N-acetylneuraminic acid mutarotase